MTTNRPRIWKQDGLWYCAVLAQGQWHGRLTGMGYTPKDAHDDWKKYQ